MKGEAENMNDVKSITEVFLNIIRILRTGEFILHGRNGDRSDKEGEI